MARTAREKSSTGVYAVILCGNENIFSESEMREVFSEAAFGYLGNGLLGLRFYDDKVHMLVKESSNGISLDMKPLTTSFARTYNRVHETQGKVWRDRFKSVPIESRAVKKECTDYLDGGELAAPYIPGARASASANKPVIKKAIQKKIEKKSVEPVKAEPEKEAKPAKKKNSLPSWLL